MKQLILVLGTLTMILLMVSSVFAAEGFMTVIPAGFVDGKHYTIQQGQNYPAIGFSYIAAEQGLVQEFIDRVDFTITFQDTEGNVLLKLTPDVVRQLWSKPSRAQQTIHNISPQSMAYWKVPLAVLPPGEYEMHTVVNIPETITNGLDCDCNGWYDVFSPDVYNKEYIVYIHISG